MKPDGFRIGFDKRDLFRLYSLWEDVIESEEWSVPTGGHFVSLLEEKWEAWNGLPAVAMSSWAGAAKAALEFFRIRGKMVLCPSNTFVGTPMSVTWAGGDVGFVDCNRFDLCVSYDDLEHKIGLSDPCAVFVVHIGGHIAFEIERIAALCQERGILLFEDCAHAAGAEWNGRKPGTWGDAGFYSLSATKPISTGEGGILVSRDPELIAYARRYRDYGRGPQGPDGKFKWSLEGMNFTMDEFRAAIGCVQVDRLPEMVAWKNERAQELHKQHPNHLILPDGMVSNYYKYIVFDEIENSTGKVYDDPCHRIFGCAGHLPNTEWVAENHWCVPLYYRGDEG